MSLSARNPEYPIDPLFVERWSPRAITGEPIDEPTLFSLFEAARWAPSANNAQPWRFVYARSGTAAWESFFGLLNENNRVWAAKASALVVLVSRKMNLRKGDTVPTPLRTHSLDAGAAWASLSFQALRSGWHTHAIGGFDREKAALVLDVPEGYHVEVAIAIGRQGDPATLTPDLLARERPTERLPLKAIVAEGRFAFEA